MDNRPDLKCIALVCGAACLLLLLRTQYSSRKPSKKTSGFHGLVGDTPVVLLQGISELIGCKVYGKAEFMNPGGSIKDRFATHIAQKAKSSGYMGLVEATSGSTGISLALAAFSLGLQVKLFIPDDLAREKISILRALGVNVELTKPASITDPSHMCKAAEKFARENPGYYYTDQFENEENFKVHNDTTAAEIIREVPQLHYFVASAGTGGTISGISTSLKYTDSRITTILADVHGSALAARVNHGVIYHSLDREGHRVNHPVDTITEGIGLNRLAGNFAKGLECVDSAVTITDEEAVKMAYYLLHKEGLFIGSSSAVNCAAVVKAYQRGMIRPGSTVVTILCDSGMRHLSKFWSHDFLRKHGLLPSYVDSLDGSIPDVSLIASPLSFLQ